LWVNVGPLLYHYSEMAGETSIELTWEEVLAVAKQIGFSIEVPETEQVEESVESTYCSAEKSMMKTVYNSKLIKARK